MQQPESPRAAILLGQGGHNVRANRRLRALAAALAQRPGGVPVTAAFVQSGSDGAAPSLADAVDHLAAAGTREIAVVPFLAEWSYPEHQDIPDLLRDLAEAHLHVRLYLARPLGAAPGIADQLALQIDSAWAASPVGDLDARGLAALAEQTPITTARQPEGTFPDLPPQAQHLLLCAGRRCTELGSAAAYRRLAALLHARGLDAGPERVKLTRTKCLGPCAAAPVACLYPAGTYFARLDAGQMPAFVERVLVAGSTLPDHAFHPAEA